MGEETEKAPIGVVGVGWVGLVTAACFAEMGHPVVARDIVAERIEALRAGEVPMHEPGLPELVSGNADRLTFTTEVGELLEHAKLVFIAVETPPTASGDADLSSVMTAIEEVGTGGDHAVVMKSTVPVGTGRTIRRELPGVSYVSNPEFLREGSAVKDFMNPDRVVIGAEPEDADAADQLQQAYEPLGAPMVRTDIASAEMIKLASNAFLATKISFINEIANVSEQLGADVDEVARGVGLDQRIGPKFLKAGIGWGGSCFGKDVSGLKQAAGNTGYHFQLLSAVMEVNELQKRRAVGKLTDHLGDLGGKTVALLGLAFKPDTDDMRDAASIVIAARLAGEGAKVVAYDPVAQARASELMPNVEMKSSALEALDGADAVVLVTEWPEFAELDWSEAAGRMATPLLVDGRNFLPADELRAVGFTYEGIGRPAGAEGQALMQALILVGGEGTRLRPLTERRPKPVLPLVGQPFISYMLEWLRSHGVDEVVMACGFEPDALRETIGSGDAEQRVRYLVEPDPRGTAGAIRFAKEDLQERFFVLNGDVLCDLDLTELMREHTENQAIATIGLFGVADATGYGLVHRDADGWVTEFAEKPGPEEAAAGGNINAGAYVLEHAVLERIPPDREVSIERDVFPTLVGRGLRGAALDGYWLDIGTPERFLQASWDILEGRVETEIGKRAPDGLLVAEGAEISPEATIRAPAAIADGVVVEAGAEVGPRAVIDKGSRVAEGAVVERSLIGEGCSVGAGAALRGAILAPRVEVEPEAELGPGSVVGEDEKVPAREGAR